MEAGKLRHRVEIQQDTPTQDSYGQPIPGWATIATVWAAIEPMSGRERFAQQSDQVLATVDTKIRIRWRSGLTPLMRVRWGSRIYLIEAVVELVEGKREVNLLCTERNND